jgi:spoIIIJ-associated protein
VEDSRKRFTGRDVAEALAAAREHFKLSRRELGFEVVEQPKVGPVEIVSHDLVEIEAWPLPPDQIPAVSPGAHDERQPRFGGRGSGPGRRGPRERDRREAPAGRERHEEPFALPSLVPGEDVTDPVDVLRHVVGSMLKGLDMDLGIGDVEKTEAGYRVSLHGADAPLLTEEDAEGLDALQYLVNRLLLRDPRGVGRVSVDAGGFRKEHETELLETARRLAAEVLETGEKREMSPIGPFERRLVHLELSDLEGIRTYSSGHGYKRKLNIAPGSSDRRTGPED